MTAENVDKRCKDCAFGEQSRGGMLNIPVRTAIPLNILVTPKIRRNCLNIIDTTLKRKSRVVGLNAKRVKPKSYTPLELEKPS